MRLTVALLLAAAPAAVNAHSPWDAGALSHLPIWAAQAVLLAAWLLYVPGAARRRPSTGERAAFHGGMAVAAMSAWLPFLGAIRAARLDVPSSKLCC